MKVYICQLKCPANHCVMALAGEYESQETADAELRSKLFQAFDGLVESGSLNRECGLCHSNTLIPETRPTIFGSMEEARSELAAAEVAALATARAWKPGRN